MFTVKEDTTLVGISELRAHFDRVLCALHTHKVLLEKRNKPLAVIVPIEKYNQMEALIDLIEDAGLGYIAQQRYLKSKPSDYLTIDEVEKKLKRRK